MNNFYKILAVSILCIILIPLVSADERIVNGNFSNNLTGWTEGIENVDAGATFNRTANDRYYNVTITSNNGAQALLNITQIVNLSNVKNITYTFNLTTTSSDASAEFDLLIDETTIVTITENPTLYPIVETSDVSMYSGEHLVTFSFSGTSAAATDDIIKFSLDNISANGIPPSADFTSVMSGSTIPLTVDFTDISTNNPTVWQWDFGDGTTNTTKNPRHIYTTIGDFTVGMRSENSAGWSAWNNKTHYINTTSPLVTPTTIVPASSKIATKVTDTQNLITIGVIIIIIAGLVAFAVSFILKKQ